MAENAGRDVVASERGGIARAAVARAQREGALGQKRARPAKPALTPAQVQLRDWAIVTASQAGMSAREIAKSFGLTPRSIERIIAAFNERPTALEQMPMELIEESLRVYRAQMASATRVAVDTLERQPAVAISALRLHSEVFERYSELLRRMGKLPDDLEVFRGEAELVRLALTLRDGLLKVERGEMEASELRRSVESLVLAESPLPVIEGHERPHEG